MRILFHANFKKKYRKLSRKLALQAEERIALFAGNLSDSQLHNHPLRGKYLGYYSINITGDYRALYRIISEEVVEFVDVDTHANLYK